MSSSRAEPAIALDMTKLDNGDFSADRRHVGDRKRKAPTPSRWRTTCSAVSRSQAHRSARSRSHGTRNYGRPQPRRLRAAVPSRPRHLSIVVLISLAIGWREAWWCSSSFHHHPADDVRLVVDGLHDQPRQPVRPDLLDRILVDDAIVVVEISPPLVDARRARLVETAVEAVAEVGNPTIVATLTSSSATADDVLSGMMGPLYEPIPQRLDPMRSRSASRSPHAVLLLRIAVATPIESNTRKAYARHRRARRLYTKIASRSCVAGVARKSSS